MERMKLGEIKFNIIRHRGTPDKAQLPNGTWVHKEDKFFVPEYEGFIPCAPYDDHFLYEMPKDIPNVPSYACSCGSVAVIVDHHGYVLDASPQGKMFVCLVHATFGHHSNMSKWI